MHPATDLPPGGSTGPQLRVRRLGVCSFNDALALQERSARSVAAGGDDELLYVEHPAVITLGRGTTADQLLASRRQLASAGISVVETDRGGGATFHGRGQIVGYPIIGLWRRGIGVRSYLRALEAALIAALRSVGVSAFVRPGLTGVWTVSGKLAAIGIAVRRGITRHGFALNVETDLEAFTNIVPCGLHEPVTSLRKLGWEGDSAELAGRLAVELESFLQHPSVPATQGVVPAAGFLAGHQVRA